jgi:hypothetical protein
MELTEPVRVLADRLVQRPEGLERRNGRRYYT